jgi:hypothetical protein
VLSRQRMPSNMEINREMLLTFRQWREDERPNPISYTRSVLVASSIDQPTQNIKRQPQARLERANPKALFDQECARHINRRTPVHNCRVQRDQGRSPYFFRRRPYIYPGQYCNEDREAHVLHTVLWVRRILGVVPIDRDQLLELDAINTAGYGLPVEKSDPIFRRRRYHSPRSRMSDTQS